MADREKVIKGLECCILNNPDDKQRCSDCPYDGNCLNRLKMDALELLKERKTTKPEQESRKKLPCKCGRQRFRTAYNFVRSVYVIECPECGNSAEGKTEIDAIRNWNRSQKGYDD